MTRYMYLVLACALFCLTTFAREDHDLHLRDILQPYTLCAAENFTRVSGAHSYDDGYLFSPLEKIINSGICVIVDSDCISGIGNFLRNILFPFLPKKDCASKRKVVPPIIDDNPGESAFLSCAGVVYNDPLEQLFPPSKSVTGVPPKVDLKIAKRSMEKFCLYHQQYAQCVSKRIEEGYNYFDHLTAGVVNTWDLEDAFDLYCNNRDLILGQYECALKGVSLGTCLGGVEHLLTAGARQIGRNPAIQTCKELQKSVTCRLDTQLNQCSPDFISVMRQFYNLILGTNCFPEQFRPNQMTDSLSCYANVPPGLQGVMSSEKSSSIETIAKEIEYICESGKDEGLTDCMYKIYSSPTKPQNVFSSKLIAARNIKPLSGRACSLVPGLKLNAECISGGFAALIKGPDNCISTYSDNIVAVMLNGTGDVEIEDIMCRNLASLKPCLIPVFTTCDKSLGDSLGSIFDDMMQACNNPSYQVQGVVDSGKTPSASRLAHIFLIATITVLLMIL